MDIKKLKSQAKLIEPIIRIGKLGVTEPQLKEIEKLLKKRKLIKIKMLNSFVSSTDRKAVAKELAEKTGSVLVDSIGNVVVLYKNH